MAELKIKNLGGDKKYKQPQTEILPLTEEAFRYLTGVRKLSRQVIDAYRVGTTKAGEIALPFYDENNNLRLIKFRDAQGKMLRRRRKTDTGFEDYEAKTVCEPGGKPVLFGSHLCDASEGALVICFGDYDAMSVSESGVPNCVSLPFGDGGFDFIDYQWNFLEKFDEIILFPDNDKFPNLKVEQNAKKKLDELANRLGKHRVKLVNSEDMQGTKDANELLQKHGREACRHAITSADWFPTGIVAVADFVELDAQEGTPSGLSDLDAATGGLCAGQLIVISGDNGSGKTTEALNIAANFIEEGTPVFLWSGEQSVGKIRYWFERIVAGRMNLRRVIGERTGFHYFFPIEDCIETIRHWYRNFLFQYVEVGITPEKFFDAAELGVRRYGCGLIIIDNLMAFTGGEGESYFQAQGDFAESCKRFAEKFQVPVILVCHNRKEDENRSGWLPTKNSVEGAKKITNWADLVVQMFRVPEGRKAEFDNADAVLLICKARESGRFEGIRLAIDTDSNRFCQMSEENGNDRKFGWEFDWQKTKTAKL